MKSVFTSLLFVLSSSLILASVGHAKGAHDGIYECVSKGGFRAEKLEIVGYQASIYNHFFLSSGMINETEDGEALVFVKAGNKSGSKMIPDFTLEVSAAKNSSSDRQIVITNNRDKASEVLHCERAN